MVPHLSLYFVFALLCYLVGSLPFAVLVSKLYGLQDPRQYGSGNPGATNVMRSGNKSAALLTLFLDAFKGFIMVQLAWYFFEWPGYARSAQIYLVAIAIVCVYLGHVYSLFLKGKGGKGVATSLGVLIALSPLLAMATLVVWVLAFAISRISSLGAILSAVAMPLLFWLGHSTGIYAQRIDWHVLPPNGFPVIAGALVLISLITLWRHRSNIVKMIKGQEQGFKKK